MKKEYILTLLFLYLVAGYIPNFAAADEIAPQWLYLGYLNLISLLSLSISKETKRFKKVFRSWPILFFIGFVIWNAFSFFYAVNQSETILELSRWINVLISLINCSYLLSHLKNPSKWISYLMVIAFTIEFSYSFYQYLQFTKFFEYNFSLANEIKGITANKNITSASITSKLPFVLFFILSNNKVLSIIARVLFILGLYTVLLLSARASYISIFGIIFFIILVFSLRDFKKRKFLLLRKKAPLILFLFFSVIVASTIILGKDNNASITERITTINTEDTSAGQRLRFYGHALTQLKNNPLIGVGLGNWKIKSIEYDRLNMSSYVVPYHVHNDFLQIGTETGVLGILLYLSIFIYVGFISFIRSIDIKNKFSFEYLTVGLSLMVYFIDANLNFPHARVINQIVFIFLIAYFISLNLKEKELRNE